MPTELGTYQEFEERIRATDRDGLLARWEFGRALVRERDANGGNRLPNGRLDALRNTLRIRSRRELQRRMQFAEQYPTEGRVADAFAEYSTWHEIVRRGLGRRRAQPGGAIAAEQGPLRKSVPRLSQHPIDWLTELLQNKFWRQSAHELQLIGLTRTNFELVVL